MIKLFITRLWQNIFPVIEAFDLDDDKGHIDLSKIAGLSLIVIGFMAAFDSSIKLSPLTVPVISLGAAMLMGRKVFKLWLTRARFDYNAEVSTEERFDRNERDDFTKWES